MIPATAAGKPFIAVNCAAVPESLLESELFGHGRGAFTGAVAAKPGSSNWPTAARFCSTKSAKCRSTCSPNFCAPCRSASLKGSAKARSVHVDIRVIATTNVSLASMVERGQFRADLYYRLNVIPLSLPPLRERREDIPVLAQHFAREICGAATDQASPASSGVS